MNQHGRPPPGGEARVKFLGQTFQLQSAGTFVRCAVTAAPIPLDQLLYWSIERQEAYAGPEAVLERLSELKKLRKAK